MDERDPTRRALLAALPALLLAAEEARALGAAPAAGQASGAARPPAAQDPLHAQPNSFRVVLENEHVRVLEYNSRPGMAVCGLGMHSHPAHLTVVLTAGRVRIRTPDGRTLTTPETPPGLVFWSEAETHEVENVLGRDMRSLIVELKPRPA